MRDNLPEMLRAAAKEWRAKNQIVGVGETRYDVALEEAADVIKELQKAVNFHKFNSEFWEDKFNSLADEKWISVTDIDDATTIITSEGKGYILAPQEDYDGLKRKYVVLKSDTGDVVENCFVLRPDKDKAAIAALLAYADATDSQVLAKDIRAWISTIPAEDGET